MDTQYISLLDTTIPFDKSFVELWDFSDANKNEEARIEAITTVASISYGNISPKDRKVLYHKLIELGHESPFEFVRYYGSINGYCKDWTLREINFPYNSENSKALKRKVATFKLKVPIFVARQIMRHRSFSFMEISRRYVNDSKVPFEFYHPPGYKPITSTLPNGKSISYSTFSMAVLEYKTVINSGIKPEQARTFIPIGAYTQFWMQGNSEAWLNFFIHRLHPSAQEETRKIANAMWNLLLKNQKEIIYEMIIDAKKYPYNRCNKIFISSRLKKVSWFMEKYLLNVVSGEDELEG